MEQENQEIDYKAEYEKMANEKEREEVINNLKKVMNDEGYCFDEEIFSSNCPQYNNYDLKNFGEMFKTLKPQSNRGFIIGAKQPKEQYFEQERTTFEDYIKRKKN